MRYSIGIAALFTLNYQCGDECCINQASPVKSSYHRLVNHYINVNI